MDIFLKDLSEIPLPPDEIRIKSLHAETWPDGRRVKVNIQVDPFQKRPNADLVILDANQREIAQVSIIESIERNMELTMHLRGPDPTGPFILQATLFYTDIEEQLDPQEKPRPVNRTIVDEKQIQFDID